MRKTYAFLLLMIFLLLLSPPVFYSAYYQQWVGVVKRAIGGKPPDEVSPAALVVENQILKSQLAYIKEWVQAQQKVEEFFSELKKLEKAQHVALIGHEAQKKRIKIVEQFLKYFSQYALGRVIFIEPFASSSLAWIDIGENYNQQVGEMVVAKNSPVVLADQLVGVVEEVYPKFSKIRLITDPKLAIHVKAIRGKEQMKDVQAKAEDLLDCLELMKDIKYERKEELIGHLIQLAQELKIDGHDRDYALGEISGSEYSFLSKNRDQLVGTGFSLKGSYRQRQDDPSKGFQEIAVMKGDLLVSTGKDGVIPAGLKVGWVIEVGKASMGKSTYALRARPACQELHRLEYVQVLPPMINPAD